MARVPVSASWLLLACPIRRHRASSASASAALPEHVVRARWIALDVDTLLWDWFAELVGVTDLNPLERRQLPTSLKDNGVAHGTSVDSHDHLALSWRGLGPAQTRLLFCPAEFPHGFFRAALDRLLPEVRRGYHAAGQTAIGGE